MPFRSEHSEWMAELRGERRRINWWLIAGAGLFAAIVGFTHLILH